jgi:hypothetical protein
MTVELLPGTLRNLIEPTQTRGASLRSSGLHLVAPAERADPIAEGSIRLRTVVDEPDNDRSVRTRTNHRVRHTPSARRILHITVGFIH